jgi:hypothetical protein
VDLSITRAIRLNERVAFTLEAEVFDLLNHANYKQNSVDNLLYTTSQRCGAFDGEGSCSQPLPIWDVTGTNPDFAKPSSIAPKYSARSFQFSARISF